MDEARSTVSAEEFERLVDEIEDLEDRLSVFEHDGVAIDFEKLVAELSE